MKASRFSEEQIIGILREQGAGQKNGGCLPPPRHCSAPMTTPLFKLHCVRIDSSSSQ